MNGPDLPTPSELFDVDACRYRWPTGAEKVELYHGVPVFQGQFDERDVAIAQGAYPGRQIVLNESGGIEIHPAAVPPRSIFDTIMEQLAQRRPETDQRG
ncbi:hypothetical protein LWC34_53565 [Kibdelosporangium philippinense]|uniref:Uncharacterized protein n=1 Tax=Kibdelosporangium philippinense TaxID=211113 RepID=A0ABS8ZVG0_9PSEU|nr:hypothetical protein [Kibdelosporangium philippinense]MCE7011587.1 hypothetical protein [Kibdelosporangium philippinense]